MASREGVEPPTCPLGGGRSIRLSYRDAAEASIALSFPRAGAHLGSVTPRLQSTMSTELADLPPVEALARVRAALDAKTKPPGSLGRLEDLAARLALVQGTLAPSVDPARAIVFAADHGVADEGVSAYPKAVTAEMAKNFAAGGAAVSVIARANGIELRAVDVGVDADLSGVDGLVHEKVRRGTDNLARGPAMSHEDVDAALGVGRRAIVDAAEAGCRAVCLGEMGIGNTTSAAILTAALTGGSAAAATGAGTGVAGEALEAKRALVARALERAAPLADDPAELLCEVGGLEIAALVGAMTEAPAHRIVTVVDGFIATAAALVAVGMRPALAESLFFAHRSAEPGHGAALEALGATPVLDLGLRLGEGSGAVLALPVLRGAAAVLRDMATFESAGVSGAVDG